MAHYLLAFRDTFCCRSCGEIMFRRSAIDQSLGVEINPDFHTAIVSRNGCENYMVQMDHVVKCASCQYVVGEVVSDGKIAFMWAIRQDVFLRTYLNCN